MKYVVYQIRCKRTDKVYIGKHQTENLDDGYMGSGKLLRRAIKKHGVENFEKTILHVYDNEADMNSKEAELVTEEFCYRKDTYNLCPGGKGGWGYVNQNGLRPTDNLTSEVSRKGALSNIKRNPHVLENLEKHRFGGPFFAGKKHSEETKEKMRRNHNPASHPRGPRGPYKKRNMLP